MPSQVFSQEGRLEELLRHASDVVVELAPDGRLLYVSDAVERVLGRTAQSLVGLSFLEVVVPKDRPNALSAFRKVVETGDGAMIPIRVARMDGLRVELETTLRSFVSESHGQRIVAICHDVTERSARVAVDRQRNAYHRALAESGARPAAIADADGTIRFSNRRFREVFGNEVGVRELLARVSPESRISLESAWYQTTHAPGSSSGSHDFEFRRDDGSFSWYSASWEAIQSEDGQRRFALFCEDITQRKKIEHALRTIASGFSFTEPEELRPMIAMIAQALEMDRLVLGLLDEDSGPLHVLVAWQDGEFIDIDRLELEGLPDSAVARGDACLHPTGVCQLMPSVAERMGPDFESYAGFPLRRLDGGVIGIIGGYGRKSIRDPDLMRSLLSSFATHAGAAIDRQRIDAEISANQDRFDALALQSDDMLIEVDANARIIYMSQASRSVLGIEPEDLLGRRVEELTHPDDHPTTRLTHAQLITGKGSWVTVSRGRHANGSWRWLESKISTFTASDGSPRAILLVRDITERRRGELGRDLLYRVVQRGADLVFVCQPDMKLLFANEAATRLVHWPSNDDSGRRTFDQLLSTKDAERLRIEILPRLEPTKPWSGELALSSSTGEEPIPTEATIFWFQGTEESAGRYLAITLRDIAKRRSAEEALRESEIRLSQAQKMEAIGRLTGGIAHDFNNLLTAIIGYSDLVLDQLGEEHGARSDTEEILRAAERAGGLTRQLLAFSRRQVIQPELMDLNAIVADTDRMLRRLIGENIELVTLQNGELHAILADPGQIEQVIVNLVVNSRDAMPRGGRIEIETTNFTAHEKVETSSGPLEIGDYVVLRVSDTGTGMEEAVLDQIFQPFFTTKQAHQGTGLGLASAHDIVSQNGGQIDVESVPDQGTTFSVYLPAARETLGTPDPTDRDLRTEGHETILLVEDSDSVRQLIQRTLEKSGYRVLAAESATAALRYCSRHSGEIDLLLTDVVLPRTPGPEVARRVVELRPGIRVLFMSGFTDDTLVRQGLRPGTSELLEKPFSPATALVRIRKLLDSPVRPLEDTLSSTSFPVEHS